MLQLVLLIVFNLFAQSPAESKPSSPAAKTSDLVIVSGGHSQERLKRGQLLTIDGRDGHVIRSFALSPRPNVQLPQEFHIWSRGLGDVYFFEWLAGTDPATTSTNAANASQLINTLRSRGLLTQILHVNISSVDPPKLIGYIQRVDPDSAKVGGEILIAAKNAEPKELPVGVEVAQEESLFSKMWAAIPTTLIGLVGTLGGAVIGYKFFLYQQDRLRRIELEKKFADKKVEMSKAIRKFFKDDYDGLRNSQDADIEKVRQIRDTLIETNIYAILLPEEVQQVNKLSDQNQSIRGSRVDALHRVLERNFAELMV